MKAIMKRTLIILMLLALLIGQTGCTSRENIDVLLYYTKLYALAHGFWEDDGSRDGQVDVMGLYGHIVWGTDSRYKPPADHGPIIVRDPYFRGISRRGDPYDVAVRSVFMVTGLDEEGRFWGI